MGELSMKYRCIKSCCGRMRVGQIYDVMAKEKFGMTVYDVVGERLELGEETISTYLEIVEDKT